MGLLSYHAGWIDVMSICLSACFRPIADTGKHGPYRSSRHWVLGGTHMMIKTYGICYKNRSVFCKKSLTMGPIFHESLTMGQSFKISWVHYAKPRKIVKIWCVFVAKSQEVDTFYRKIPKYGYLFEKLPLNMVWVLSCRWHIHDQSKSEYPPGLCIFFFFFFLFDFFKMVLHFLCINCKISNKTSKSSFGIGKNFEPNRAQFIVWSKWDNNCCSRLVIYMFCFGD